MHYNFDEIIERKGSNCLKHDALRERFGRTDLTPLWIADMDFRTPDCVINAVKERCLHEVFGYTCKPLAYYHVICQWNERRHNWTFAPECIDFSPGVVPGLAFTINCFTRPGDKILIQPPVYNPFQQLINHTGRTLVCNPLRIKEGQFLFDAEHFANAVQGCSLFILCNPHNPGGKVWSADDLRLIASVCKKEGCVVVSDEIHADLTLPPHHHIPFATVSEEARLNCITFMAPSKTFNMAGLASAYSIIENNDIRRKYRSYVEGNEWNQGNIFSFAPVVAVYEQGEEWLSQLLPYIQKNIDTVQEFLDTELPVIKMIRPQASFLIFLDCRELGLTQQQLVKFFINEAHLAMNDGSVFGEEGKGFMRMNVGCPRKILTEALLQLKNAIKTVIK